MVNRAREMRQLWLVAKRYWELASEGLNHHASFRSATVKEMATWFDASMLGEQEKQDLTFAVAHMTSAAIRLTTIDEIFQKDGKQPPITDGKYDNQHWYIPENFRPPYESFPSQVKKYIHQLLRDNAGHWEYDTKRGLKKNKQSRIRQEFLESRRIDELIAWMKDIMQKYEAGLSTII